MQITLHEVKRQDLPALDDAFAAVGASLVVTSAPGEGTELLLTLSWT